MIIINANICIRVTVTSQCRTNLFSPRIIRNVLNKSCVSITIQSGSFLGQFVKVHLLLMNDRAFLDKNDVSDQPKVGPCSYDTTQTYLSRRSKKDTLIVLRRQCWRRMNSSLTEIWQLDYQSDKLIYSVK